jgi:hypothetical protein
MNLASVASLTRNFDNPQNPEILDRWKTVEMHEGYKAPNMQL